MVKQEVSLSIIKKKLSDLEKIASEEKINVNAITRFDFRVYLKEGSHWVEVITQNNANIELNEKRLIELISAAELPDCRLKFLFYDNVLLDKNNNEYQALTDSSKRIYNSVIREIHKQNKDAKTWDVCITVSRKYCDLSTEYPAYFVYLLGHEIGHAKICLTDLELHDFYCFIQQYIKYASNYCIKKWMEMPHELLFDQFGIYLCEKLYSREKLNDEIKKLIEKSIYNDVNRLERMLMLEGTNDLSNLEDDLIRFSNPYKNQLISLGRQYNENSAVSLLTSRFF